MSSKFRAAMSSKFRAVVVKVSGCCRQSFGLDYRRCIGCFLALHAPLFAVIKAPCPLCIGNGCGALSLMDNINAGYASAFGLLLIAFDIAGCFPIIQYIKAKVSVIHYAVTVCCFRSRFFE